MLGMSSCSLYVTKRDSQTQMIKPENGAVYTSIQASPTENGSTLIYSGSN